MKMPFEWVVGDSSKGLHGDRAHVYDETGHRELHHVKGRYCSGVSLRLCGLFTLEGVGSAVRGCGVAAG